MNVALKHTTENYPSREAIWWKNSQKLLIEQASLFFIYKIRYLISIINRVYEYQLRYMM